MHEPAKIFGFRREAILELVLFFAVMFAAEWLIMTYRPDWGLSQRFMGINPHPYWAIVLLISVQYGVNEGLLAALVATLCYLVGNVPEQGFEQDRYSYILALATWPVLWLLSGVFLGLISQRHIDTRNQLSEDLADAQERENGIAGAYSRLKELKENLELRVAGQFRSSIEAYRAAKEMEKLNTTDVLGGIQRLVGSVMNPEKFSVYMLTANGLENTIHFGWNEQDRYLSAIPAGHGIYNAVIGGQQLLCVANSEQETILQGQGVLAGPLFDSETGEVVGMLKIERLGFLDLNLSSIETFRTLCEWIGLTLVNARRYQQAKSESMVNPDHKLMSYSYFQHYSDYTTTLAKRIGFDVSMLMVTLANSSSMIEDQRRRAAVVLSESVNDTLRAVDLAFDYQTNGAEYAIVLPATNTDGARIVLDKLSRDLNDRMRKQGVTNANFAFTVNPLHQHQRKAS